MFPINFLLMIITTILIHGYFYSIMGIENNASDSINEYISTTGMLSTLFMTTVFFYIIKRRKDDNTESQKKNLNVPSEQTEKYFPKVIDAKKLKNCEVHNYNIFLLTDVKCVGDIKCDHLLVAIKKGENVPSYAVSSEVNNSLDKSKNSGTHCLVCYPGIKPINICCSDDWGNLELFEMEAHKIITRELMITSN